VEKEQVITTGDMTVKEETSAQLEHRLREEQRDNALKRRVQLIAFIIAGSFIVVAAVFAMYWMGSAAATPEQRVLGEKIALLILGGVIGFFFKGKM
jgi:predicted phage tail protein